MSWYKNLGESLAEGLAQGTTNYVQASNTFEQQRQQQANVEAERRFKEEQAAEQRRQYDADAAFRQGQEGARNAQWDKSFALTQAQEGRAATEWGQKQAITPFTALIEDIDGQITELSKVSTDVARPLYERENARLGLAELRKARITVGQQRTAAWQGKFTTPDAAAAAYDEVAGHLVGLTGKDYLSGAQAFQAAGGQTATSSDVPGGTLTYADTPSLPAPTPEGGPSLPTDPKRLELLARSAPGKVGAYTDADLAATYGQDPNVLAYVTQVRDGARTTAIGIREKDEGEIAKLYSDGIINAAKTGKLTPQQQTDLQALQDYMKALQSAGTQTTPDEDRQASEAYARLVGQQVYTVDTANTILDKNADGTYRNPERIATLLRNPEEAAKWEAIMPGFGAALETARPAVQTYLNRAQDAADLSGYGLKPEQLANPKDNPEALRPLFSDLKAFAEGYAALPQGDTAAREQYVQEHPALSRLSAHYENLAGVLGKVDREGRQATDTARDEGREAFLRALGLSGEYTPASLNAAAKMLSSNATLQAQGAQYGLTAATLAGAVGYMQRNPAVDVKTRVDLLPTVAQSLAVLYPTDAALTRALKADQAAVAGGKASTGLAALFETYAGVLGGPGALVGTVSAARTTWANKLTADQAAVEKDRAQTHLTNVNAALRPTEAANDTTRAAASAQNAQTGVYTAQTGRINAQTAQQNAATNAYSAQVTASNVQSLIQDRATNTALRSEAQTFSQQLDLRKQAVTEAGAALNNQKFSWQQKQDLVNTGIRQSELAIRTYNALNSTTGAAAGSDPTLKKLDGDLATTKTQLQNSASRLAVLEKKGSVGTLPFRLSSLTDAEQAEYKALTSSVGTLNARYNNLAAKRLNYTPPAAGQATGAPAVTLSVGKNGNVTLGPVTTPPRTAVPAGRPIPTTGLPATGAGAPPPPTGAGTPVRVGGSAVTVSGVGNGNGGRVTVLTPPEGLSTTQADAIGKKLVSLRTDARGLATYLRGLSTSMVGPGKPFSSNDAFLTWTKSVLNLR